MRTKLREFHSPERLAEIYATPYDHTRWDDHKKRIAETIAIATDFGHGRDWRIGVDLSCGDGVILSALKGNGTVKYTQFGDMVDRTTPPFLQYVGPIEDTLLSFLPYNRNSDSKPIDLLILSETIEHVEDPDLVLRLAHNSSRHMVLSTPIGETTEYGNEEHYWGWDVSDVEEMLQTAGWTQCDLTILYLGFYDFQVWTCS